MAKNWISSETEILERIVEDKQALANTISFMLNTVYPFPERPYAQNILIAINVPRIKLGLNPKDKPGDIDYLIIPYSENDIMISKTIAIEAKIVRPTINNPAKNANSMGGKQAKGLIKDGFPYIGLLHISIPEALPDEMKQNIPIYSGDISDDGQGWNANTFGETGQYKLIDMFPAIHASRHKGRIVSMNLPETIGYNVIALSITKDGENFSGYTLGDTNKGKYNSDTSIDLIKAIDSLMKNEPEMFTKIIWYD